VDTSIYTPTALVVQIDHHVRCVLANNKFQMN